MYNGNCLVELDSIKLHDILSKREFSLKEIKDMVENIEVGDYELISAIKELKKFSEEVNRPLLYDLAGNYALLVSKTRIHVIQYVNNFYYDEFQKQL